MGGPDTGYDKPTEKANDNGPMDGGGGGHGGEWNVVMKASDVAKTPPPRPRKFFEEGARIKIKR